MRVLHTNSPGKSSAASPEGGGAPKDMPIEEGEHLREMYREQLRRQQGPLIAQWRAKIEALAVEAAAIQQRALLSDQAVLIGELVAMRAKVEALKAVEQHTAADREAELLADRAARQQEAPDAAASDPRGAGPKITTTSAPRSKQLQQRLLTSGPPADGLPPRETRMPGPPPTAAPIPSPAFVPAPLQHIRAPLAQHADVFKAGMALEVPGPHPNTAEAARGGWVEG
ncbi:unnamed protein product [Vitrella brassicaformis CCMP3155]|uniref:Uncharacterized protein n=1 Tax=Vitrella brassicaformis (strain CCMP3155) TaxID=1169540 RepID=A0A0G4E9S3_VITBC|nr:unnamed protein product [Vitrella brassicaformis CCMP3155]|eukprot:CEL91946.1 unnamed protein product [Vitrella brassicaformis CCMP3155]